MESVMNSLISKAIQEMKLLEFYYDGFYRKVEPHTYGISKSGNEMLIAFQIRGGSKEGSFHNWKQFKVDKMERINILDQTFEKPRPDYIKGDKKIKLIFCEL
jgi:predicted DNA-binding transcriptional regulator YafY